MVAIHRLLEARWLNLQDQIPDICSLQLLSSDIVPEAVARFRVVDEKPEVEAVFLDPKVIG